MEKPSPEPGALASVKGGMCSSGCSAIGVSSSLLLPSLTALGLRALVHFLTSYSHCLLVVSVVLHQVSHHTGSKS